MLYYERIVNSLKRGVVAPVYLFYGEEVYLREQAVERFKESLLTQTADFNFDVLDGERVEPAEVATAASTPPVMAEHRLVLVKNPPWFSGGKKTGGKQAEGKESREPATLKPLLDYLANPLTTTCLIFNAGITVDRRRKIYKAVEKAGQAVEFTRLRSKELAGWLDSQCRLEGIRLEPAARELLISGTGNGLTGLEKEWQKLITYLGDGKQVRVEDLKQVIHYSVEYKIFDVMNAIGQCRYGLALEGIKELLINKEPPQIILTMVARQFRLMLQVKELSAQGLSAPDIARRINEKPYPVQNALKLHRNFTRRQLIRSLIQLAELDADTKTGRQEFYPGIERLLLNIAR
ncbi:DNA polymerase III subunit delta [Desulfofalx alkaliphila]|uniref:DNA polymerase III subunit delta n=1 Tax=Desulfofalx alkaliphila TaxID=105483 RepID=UPI0004E14020|nr:DNA polymerase III subunit delta [Desulfofalx alkaliphila]